MKKSFKDKFFDLSKESSIWLGIITLTVVLAGDVFSDSIDTKTALLIIALVIVALIFQGYLISTAVQKDFFDKINDLETFIRDNGMDKIVSEKSLAIIEKNAHDIWVFSNDLKNDLPDKNSQYGHFVAKAVEKNLQNGKSYTYFVPDTIKGKINAYKSRYKNFITKEKQVRFVIVDNEYFFFPSEIVFYDPHETYDDITQVVQFFPDDSVNYYIGFAKNYQIEFFGKISHLLENEKIRKIEYFS